MHVTRGLAVVALSGLASFGAVAPALAAPCTPNYPPGNTCTVSASVSSQSVAPGQPFSFQAKGYAAGARVVVQLHSAVRTLGTFTANGSGVASGSLTVPKGFSGAHTLTFTGRMPSGGTATASVGIFVNGTTGGADTAAGTGNGTGTGISGRTGGQAVSGLPFTGAEIGLASTVGVALVGGGAFLVVAGRRRRAAAA